MRENTDGFIKRAGDGRKEDSADFERCIVCGRLTDVRKDTPIDARKTYLPGGGQMCADCCYELYHTTDLRMASEQ